MEVAKKQVTNFKIDAGQFTMWLFLVSIAMLFAAFTSAFIVRKAQGEWVDIQLPSIFLQSCCVVLGASATMILSQKGQKINKPLMIRLGLLSSLVLGIVFVGFQFSGWQELMNQGVYLVGNPSGSFLFVISGIHALHVAVGILAIFIILVRSFILKKSDLKSLKIGSLAIYWHFVGGLWIYLYLFLQNA